MELVFSLFSFVSLIFFVCFFFFLNLPFIWLLYNSIDFSFVCIYIYTHINFFPLRLWVTKFFSFHLVHYYFTELASCIAKLAILYTKNTESSSVLNKGHVFTDIDLARPYLCYKIKNLNECMNFQPPSSEYDIHSSLGLQYAGPPWTTKDSKRGG